MQLILCQAMRTDNLLERLSKPWTSVQMAAVQRSVGELSFVPLLVSHAKGSPRKGKVFATQVSSFHLRLWHESFRHCSEPGAGWRSCWKMLSTRSSRLAPGTAFCSPHCPIATAPCPKAGRQTKAEEREGHLVPSKQHEGRVAFRIPWSNL